jgi:type II secretory pathway pseudopilin PulG
MTQVQKKTLGLAIASLVFGCLFIIPLLGILFSLTALVLGIVSLVIISKNKETIKGKGLAIAGIALGSIGIIVTPIIGVIVAIAVPSFLRSSGEAQMASAKAALRTISNAYEYYYVENNEYPASISVLTEAETPYLEEESIDFARKNYTFDCKTQDSYDYVCTATPVKCGVTGAKVFKIDTTSEISEEDCKK